MKVILNTEELTKIIKDKYPESDAITIFYSEPNKVIEQRLGINNVIALEKAPERLSYVINL